jgi:GntR family transcriptional regulator
MVRPWEQYPDQGLAEKLLAIWLETARSGEFLPSEPSLADSLSASRPAVREALVRLEERGLLRRRQGADTVVNAAALDIRARFDEQVDQAELIRAMGRKASLEVLDARLIRLTDDDAEAFATEPGTVALQTMKRWRADDMAVMLAIDVIPISGALEVTQDLPPGIDPEEPVFRLADRHGAGPVEWELVWPGAANLDAKTAALLERRKGEAALTLELMGVSRHGAYAYRASEYHVQGAFRYGLIRSVHR